MTEQQPDETSPASRWEGDEAASEQPRTEPSQGTTAPPPTSEESDAPRAGTEDGLTTEDEDRADDEDGGEDLYGSAGQTAGGPGAALARMTSGGTPQPPRPPKRTGIFVDPEDLREHVGALLRAMLGGYQVDAWGNYTFVHEGARVFVTIGMNPIGPQVGVLSVTNVEVELSPSLAGFLLTTNHELNFGAFSFDAESEAVWLRHSLLGTTLDGPELQAAVAAIASTAAHFDDIIHERFGGRRFTDAPQDVQDATHPPEPSQEAHPNASGYL